MAGASEQTQRVSYLNANWLAPNADRVGSFAIMIVTEDGERHGVAVADSQIAGLAALIQAGSVFLWDPQDDTLIAANLVGDWLPQSWSAAPPQSTPLSTGPLSTGSDGPGADSVG